MNNRPSKDILEQDLAKCFPSFGLQIENNKVILILTNPSLKQRLNSNKESLSKLVSSTLARLGLKDKLKIAQDPHNPLTIYLEPLTKNEDIEDAVLKFLEVVHITKLEKKRAREEEIERNLAEIKVRMTAPKLEIKTYTVTFPIKESKKREAFYSRVLRYGDITAEKGQTLLDNTLFVKLTSVNEVKPNYLQNVVLSIYVDIALGETYKAVCTPAKNGLTVTSSAFVPSCLKESLIEANKKLVNKKIENRFPLNISIGTHITQIELDENINPAQHNEFSEMIAEAIKNAPKYNKTHSK